MQFDAERFITTWRAPCYRKAQKLPAEPLKAALQLARMRNGTG